MKACSPLMFWSSTEVTVPLTSASQEAGQPSSLSILMAPQAAQPSSVKNSGQQRTATPLRLSLRPRRATPHRRTGRAAHRVGVQCVQIGRERALVDERLLRFGIQARDHHQEVRSAKRVTSTPNSSASSPGS